MSGETDILGLMHQMARDSGAIIFLSNLYRVSLQKKLVKDARRLQEILKSLELRGKIKSLKFGISVQLLDTLKPEVISEPAETKYIQATLKDL